MIQGEDVITVVLNKSKKVSVPNPKLQLPNSIKYIDNDYILIPKNLICLNHNLSDDFYVFKTSLKIKAEEEVVEEEEHNDSEGDEKNIVKL